MARGGRNLCSYSPGTLCFARLQTKPNPKQIERVLSSSYWNTMRWRRMETTKLTPAANFKHPFLSPLPLTSVELLLLTALPLKREFADEPLPSKEKAPIN